MGPAWAQASLACLRLPVGAGGGGGAGLNRPPPPRVAGVLGATVPGAASTAGKLCAYLVGTNGETDAAVHRVLSLASLYAHPSNSGRHSGALASFLEAFCAHLAKRATGDADPRSNRQPTRAVCPTAALTAAATAAAAVAGRAMFSKDGALASTAPRALADVCFLAPGSVLPLAARRLARALAADASPHQLAGGADAVAAVARALLVVGLPPPSEEGGEFHDVEGGGTETLDPSLGAAFLRDAVTAFLPGLDANDADKTLAVLRLLAAALSSAGGGALPDDGDAPSPLCPVPPGLLDALLDRVLALLDALDSDGDRSDASTSGGGGGGGGGGGSFLLSSASALRPVLELAFARAPPSARSRASARLARWACARARPAVSPEAALLVNAAAAADPEAAARALLPSLLDAADAALPPSSPATRAADAPRLSSSAEAAAYWALALVSACVYRAGPAAAAHAPRVRSLAAAAAAAPSREVVQAASRLVASALAGVVGCYPLPERAEDSPDAGAPTTVAVFVDAGHLADDDHPPRWHDGPTSAAEAELAAGLVEDHFISAAAAATAAASADDREGVLAALASAEGVLMGGRGAVAEFDGRGLTEGAFVVSAPRAPSLATPAARAALATAVATVASTTSDAACLAMAARVAGSLLTAGAAEHSEAASARAAAAADADVVAEPRAARIPHAQVPRRRLPRWLVIEKVAAATTWRAGQAAWRRVWGGATAARPSASLSDVPPSYSSLLTHVLLPLATCPYGSARVESVAGVDSSLKRLPAAGGPALVHALTTVARLPPLETATDAPTPPTAGTAADPPPALLTVLAAAVAGGEGAPPLPASASPSESTASAAEDGALLGATGLLRTQALWRAACRSPATAAATLAALVAAAARAASPSALDAAASALGTAAVRFVPPPALVAAGGDAAAVPPPVAALGTALAAASARSDRHWRAASAAAAARLMLAPPADPSAAAAAATDATTGLASRFAAQRALAAGAVGLLAPRAPGAPPSSPSVPAAVAAALTTPGYGAALLHAFAGDKPAPADRDGRGGGLAARMSALLAAGPDARVAEMLAAVVDVESPPFGRSGEPTVAGIEDGSFGVRAAGAAAALARAAPEAAASAFHTPITSALAAAATDRQTAAAAVDVAAGLAAGGAPLDGWLGVVLAEGVASAAVDAAPGWAAAFRYAVCGGAAAGDAHRVASLAAALGPQPAAGGAGAAADAAARARWFTVAAGVADQLAASGVIGSASPVEAAVREWLAAALAAATECVGVAGEPATRAAAAATLVAVAGPALARASPHAPAAAATLDALAAAATAASDHLASGVSNDDAAAVAAVDAAAQVALSALRARDGAAAPALAPSILALTAPLAAVTDVDAAASVAPDAAAAVAGARRLSLPVDVASAAAAAAAAASTSGPTATARAAALATGAALWFRHAFTLPAAAATALTDAAIASLSDAKHEVATAAAAALSAHLQFGPPHAAAALRARLLASAAAAPPRSARRLGAVMGAASIARATPYASPAWVKPALATLCAAAGEGGPPAAAARRALADFKRTHERGDPDAVGGLTPDEWDAVRDAASAGGDAAYFV